MTDTQKRILEHIEPLSIYCPDCMYMDSDDQYTCTTCWCEGGNGKINVLSYLKENKELLTEQ